MAKAGIGPRHGIAQSLSTLALFAVIHNSN